MRGGYEMKYKRIIFISLLLSLIGLMCLNAISQELPFLMDLAQLELEVTNTEVVDQILSSYGLNTVTLKAGEGIQLVVVTLKGIVPHPCRIIIKNSEFSVIYEKETSLHIKVSLAITNNDSWSVSPEGFSVSDIFIKEPGPIILKVAVILPEEITNFFVRYPALAKGKATISAQAGE